MDLHRPHALAPTPHTARVVLVYKNFAAHAGISHIGLGVAALNTMRTLRALGYWVDVVPAQSAADVRAYLHAAQNDAREGRQHPISHVVISAPWIPTPDLQGLLMSFAQIHFAVVSHSNVGFLSADPNGIRLLRDGMDLSLSHHNFVVAGNSSKFVDAWTKMYGRGMRWLPNLYDCSTIKHVGHRQPWHPGQTLRIGVFGATRPLKNMVTAAGACVELSTTMRADVEIWMNTGRTEGGGGTIRNAIEQLTARLPHCRIVDSGWQSWPGFRQVVAGMHVLLAPSYTESFCMVVADGAAEGVASVASEAIDWVPPDWVGNSDDVSAIARVARRLITDHHAVDEGQAALRAYVTRGIAQWRHYLGGES